MFLLFHNTDICTISKIQFIKCMQTILFKTFLDKGHEYVDARVMMPLEIVDEGSICEESLYKAIESEQPLCSITNE